MMSLSSLHTKHSQHGHAVFGLIFYFSCVLSYLFILPCFIAFFSLGINRWEIKQAQTANAVGAAQDAVGAAQEV
jgi:hypothetical protein